MPGSENQPLNERQLEIVCHLANGHRMTDVAQITNYSEDSIKKSLGSAKKKMQANTTAHLVSLCIAKNLLVWNPQDEVRHLSNGDEGEE